MIGFGFILGDVEEDFKKQESVLHRALSGCRAPFALNILISV